MRFFSLIFLVLLAGCSGFSEKASLHNSDVTYQPVVGAELPGFSDDDLESAYQPLMRSCQIFSRMEPDAEIGQITKFGRAADWQRACRTLVGVEKSILLPSTLLNAFTPWAVSQGGNPDGLFTGYYEPELEGSYQPTATHLIPLYARPSDLVEVNLGDFRASLAGQRIAGSFADGKLKPYFTRAEIADGALDGRGLEMVWVNDAVAAFFLEIQGSGIIRLPDGSRRRIGFAAQNGHPYHAIGKTLVDEKKLAKEDVSLQSLRLWLNSNPVEARRVMNSNPSNIFFRWTDADGAVGALGVPLTGLRSMAIDPRFMPLGAPIWLQSAAENGVPALQRLMVAQDTGGAIKGAVRGDVFWGDGRKAEDMAGVMKNRGRLWVFLPKGVTPQISAQNNLRQIP